MKISKSQRLCLSVGGKGKYTLLMSIARNAALGSCCGGMHTLIKGMHRNNKYVALDPSLMH